MSRTTLVIAAAVLAMTGPVLKSAIFPSAAQETAPKLPRNTINCTQFKKTGPTEWVEVGTAVFDLGSIDDINLTAQPVVPGFFKFDGIDLYPVIEQKCGSATALDMAAGPIRGASADSGLTVGEPSEEPKSKAVQEPPLQEPETLSADPAKEAVPAAPPKSADGPPPGKCDGAKAIYAADALADGPAGDGAIEIVFESRLDNSAREFTLREMKANEIQWAYIGRMRQGRFLFTAASRRDARAGGSFTMASAQQPRSEIVSLTPSFIKPNREGQGEAILYIHGLRSLFASREESRRFRFEGARPSGLLPEAFYFDRCE